MRVVATSVYVGPNLYTRVPAIRLTVEFGPDALRRPTAEIAEPLLALLPGAAEHRAEGGAFGERLRAGGLHPAAVLAHVALELQRRAGCDLALARAVLRDGGAAAEVVYAYETEEVGLEAGDLAREMLRHWLGTEDALEDFDPAGELDRFIRYAQRRALGPSTASLIRAAQERDIPWVRLNDDSLVQFGYGRYQRRIEATITSMTPQIAVEIASDKNLTNKILSDLGLPVPKQRQVYSADEAVSAARRIGYPVVVKPLDANHGRGVAVNLNTDEEVEAAFAAAQEHSDVVLVESLIRGMDHRLVVVNGELVAAARRVPGHVVGDGRRTVAELVEEVNRDPRRGVGHEKVLTKLEIDDQALRCLADKGYTAESVPAEGEMVMLRLTANLSTGGTAIDVTDIIHPDNRDMAVRAIKAIGLDVGGIDFLTTDIAQSYRETGGAICEVNAAPGFRMHVAPTEGRPRDVAGKVMDMLFPPGTPRRIPMAAITGTNGKTTTSRMLAHILKMSGHTVGLTTTDAVYINGTLTVKGDMTGPTAAGMVLKDPSIDAAVLETARGGMVRSGLGYDRCDVSAVLNVASDHLGLGGINTLEELASVKRIVAEVAQDTVVLNADDERCLAMADHSPARHVSYVTAKPSHPLVREHIRAGGRAVVLEAGMNGDMITLYDKGAQMPLMWTHLIPATLEGKAMHNVQNAMFAAGMAHALGKSLEDIRHGLRTFDATFFQAPGRTNVFDEHPFKVILDYGHNAAAVKVMCDLVERLAPKGRRIVVLNCPGDRRDEDIVDLGRAAAGHFDRYICRDDEDLRRRAAGEVPEKLRQALLDAGVEDSRIELQGGEVEAVESALGAARPGDLVLIFAENITRSWKQIVYFGKEKGADGEPRPAAPVRRAEPDDIHLPEGARLIRDEKGVRLAVDDADRRP
ncbi:MAG TPA: cyanophycin synthetase [Alphaproteobacteria bacterium]|nr:cyanophycin synthetase [Alphaproteobacteria bacterium]